MILNSKWHEKDQSQYGIWPRASNVKGNKKSFTFNSDKRSFSGLSSFGCIGGRDVIVKQLEDYQEKHKTPTTQGNHSNQNQKLWGIEISTYLLKGIHWVLKLHMFRDMQRSLIVVLVTLLLLKIRWKYRSLDQTSLSELLQHAFH